MVGLVMLAALAVLVAIFIWGCSPSDKPPEATSDRHAGRKVTATQMAGMDRAEIRELLRRLDIREAPEATFGAMCYAMAGPPEQVEYVCPVCGEKTVYKGDLNELIEFLLPGIRTNMKLIRKITRMDISLDESSFCRQCHPADTEEPALVLNIAYDDGQAHRVPGILWEDVVLLRDFFRKKLTYTTPNEGEEPLKEHRHRIEELLGVKLEE